MKTVVVLIGNSDDKLSQARWSDFYMYVDSVINSYSRDVHFSGTSIPNHRWQNACFVGEVSINAIDDIRNYLKRLKDEFKQHSIAILVGDTEFI